MGRARPGPTLEGAHERRRLGEAQQVCRFANRDLARRQIVHRHPFAQIVVYLGEGHAFILEAAIEGLPAHAQIAGDAVHRKRALVQLRQHPRFDGGTGCIGC